jgi:phosphoribosylaminoimidazole-succinocarboxamide synthase
MPQFSTKELFVISQPSNLMPGLGVFEFTNYYSVFHFGRMPDEIEGKGESIARMTSINFELLNKLGVDNHFIRFHEPNKIEFSLFRVINPEEKKISPKENNFFVPLQVVFRNSLPKGSSFLKRVQKGIISLSQYGLVSVKPNMKLKNTIIEFTTKLENVDRYISEEYAQRISGLSDKKMRKLKEITLQVNSMITQKADELGLEHADGKIEFAISPDSQLIVVDSVGTPDENRFMYKGRHLGKQFLRNVYAKVNLDTDVDLWVEKNLPRKNWLTPSHLPSDYLYLASEMYKSLCEHWLQTKIWGALPLDDIIKFLDKFEN